MNERSSPSRHSNPRDRDPGRSHGPTPASAAPPLFDPAKPRTELTDSLAEAQADRFPEGKLNSAQLRRFFGEVKDLLHRLDAGRDYKREIEPLFKMLRSKASYAWRNGQNSKIPREFYDFIDHGVKKVADEAQFRLFAQHFEAVVGFLYGKGKVGGK